MRVSPRHLDHRHPRVLRQRARVQVQADRIVVIEPLDLSVVSEVVTDPFLDDAPLDGFLPGDELLRAGLLDTGDGT